MVEIFCLIALYVASVLISLMAHTKISYDSDEKAIKRWTIFILFFPLANIFISINLLMIEISRKNLKIESLKIDKSYLDNRVYDLNNKLEKIKKENIIKSVSVGDSFRIPNTEDWVEAVRGKICKIHRISGDYVYHTVEGVGQNYRTKIELMSDMIFINKKGVMPFKFLS